ncbi:MAG: helix-hairpin-helix domain-containing protein [bacterium]|nr:helix-hairpin-helix domain-containing protein [bacterium]
MEEQGRVNDFLSRYKLPLIMGLVGLVLLVGGMFSSGIFNKTFVKQSKYSAQPSASPSQIKVDVSGSVLSPGVYSLPSGARVEEAIRAAGGVTEGADLTYFSKSINLAQKVTDGMKVYVPRAQEAGSSGTTLAAENSLINVNTATLEQLDKLSGVGAVTAQKIVDKRPYGTIEELLTKKVVSKSVYDKIKDQVSVW